MAYPENVFRDFTGKITSFPGHALCFNYQGASLLCK
jgi:hypothetical protein